MTLQPITPPPMTPRLTDLTDWLEERLAKPEPIPEILEQEPKLTTEEAYRIQMERMDRQVNRGDRIAGYKAALTSKAMQEESGIGEPLLGTLLASRIFPEDQPISMTPFLVTTLEPELAVLLKGDLEGPGVTELDALAASAGYLPAVEIGDYRTGPKARSLQQTLVCNTFNGGVVIGNTLTPAAGMDPRLEGMVLTHNGEVRASATAVEVLGHPMRSVAFMANKLAECGRSLRAGMLLMTGSIVRGIPIAAGDTIEVEFTRVGRLSIRFGD